MGWMVHEFIWILWALQKLTLRLGCTLVMWSTFPTWLGILMEFSLKNSGAGHSGGHSADPETVVVEESADCPTVDEIIGTAAAL